jgi:hypothetical protein
MRAWMGTGAANVEGSSGASIIGFRNGINTAIGWLAYAY